MDIKNESFTSYRYTPGDKQGLSDNIVFSLLEDKKGILWVGTNSGLDRLDPNTGKFKRFGRKEGLPNEVIYGILPDDNDNIWLSTNYGIAKFNLIDYSIKSYDVNDGLQSNEFNGGAFHRGISGKLYFGGVYGLNIIDPDRITPSGNGSEVVITKLEVLGKEVQVADSSLIEEIEKESGRIILANNEYYLSENISFAQKIVLDYEHRFFSLEFSALNNPLPEKVEYSYKIDELDKNWNFAGNRNYVTYANINPGAYTFRVRAKNANGPWSITPAKLQISITPPFWKTWWFLLIELFLAFTLTIFIYRYLLKAKTNKLLTIQNEKIRITNQKLTESEKNLKELNATKDKFFSIISHDLKNPFSSLLSISESLFQNFPTIDEQEKQFGMEKIHNSVKHIYNLLENLLTWSRSQTGKLQYRPVYFNLSDMIRENISLYRLQAEKKDIHLFTSERKQMRAFGDPEMIKTVIRNLLNNAIKFSKTGGSVFIDARKVQNQWEVSIQDQGIGISSENQEKLFRQDLKFKKQGTSGEKGTGLGLLLCKEFIQKNGGTIKVKSQPGVGSTFSFSIPINENDHP
jgi:signal transduction histidine kinase